MSEADRLTRAERAIAALQAQQNATNRVIRTRAGRDRAHDEQNLEQRLRRGSLTGAQWPTRGNTPTVPTALTAPLTERLANYTSEGQGAALDESGATAFTDAIWYGAQNGSMTQPPPLGVDTALAGQNPMPAIFGPFQESGAALSALWVAAPESALGYALEMRLDPTATAADKGYMETVVRFPPSRTGATGHLVRVAVMVKVKPLNPLSGLTAKFTLEATYLDKDDADLGLTQFSDFVVAQPTAGVWPPTWSGNLTLTSLFVEMPGSVMAVPDLAAKLRLRFHLDRNDVTASDDVRARVYEFRVDHSYSGVLIHEATALPIDNPGLIDESVGYLRLRGGPSSSIQMRLGQIGAVLDAGPFGDNGLFIQEGNEPLTPDPGYTAIYRDIADGRLYAKDDSGVVRSLDGGGSGAGLALSFFLS